MFFFNILWLQTTKQQYNLVSSAYWYHQKNKINCKGKSTYIAGEEWLGKNVNPNTKLAKNSIDLSKWMSFVEWNRKK